jgi:hypothetical protein
MWDARERSGRKKCRTRILFPLMFVGLTLQPMTISGLTYVAAVASYVRQPPDEHKLRMLIYVIQNINIERMTFLCSDR